MVGTTPVVNAGLRWDTAVRVLRAATCTNEDHGGIRLTTRTKWSAESGIDYFIGRKVSGWLDELGLEHVAGEGHTAVFNGGSGWATYWAMTVRERAARLLQSGHVTQEMLAQLEN